MKHLLLRLVAAFFFLIAMFAYTPAGSNFRSLKKRPAKNSFRIISQNPYYIIVSKKDYELKVFDDEGWYATYPIVFGSKDLSDKMREGDRRTPTGTFKIIIKKIHPKWGP